ncbi:MAG: tRNA N6-adenosine threonylcarbamoyltransferase [Microgenomates bacterium OLB22]|nr:MAG: tRNA N6-adenosine threonylcarbamoyltransferase [Microgenomates bacterium OLB22]
MKESLLLAIDTSADDSCAAVTKGRRVLSNVRYSQIHLHSSFGGIFPTLAKRAHEQKLPGIVLRALDRAGITWKELDALAVTYGPGLAPALDVSLRYVAAKSQEYTLPIIPVNHMAGHLYSVFAQNKMGNPHRDLLFPFVGVLVSGGHTEFILAREYDDLTILGRTLDDAAGEALDKAARMLVGAGYPGGPIVESLAREGDPGKFPFPKAMTQRNDLNVSFSGLKTALVNALAHLSQEEKMSRIHDIAAGFQESVFGLIERKLAKIIIEYDPKMLVVAGGVSANKALRQSMRKIAKMHSISVRFPTTRALEGDNAAMIGVAAYFMQSSLPVLVSGTMIDRVPRARIDEKYSYQ